MIIMMKKGVLSLAWMVVILVTSIGGGVSAQSCVAKVAEQEYVCTQPDLKDGMMTTPNDEEDESVDYGVQQLISGNPREIVMVKKVIQRTKEYMKNVIIPNKRYPGLLNRCKDFHQLCAFWTSLGECDTNRRFMFTHCAASCRLCLLAELTTGEY